MNVPLTPVYLYANQRENCHDSISHPQVFTLKGREMEMPIRRKLVHLICLCCFIASAVCLLSSTRRLDEIEGIPSSWQYREQSKSRGGFLSRVLQQRLGYRSKTFRVEAGSSGGDGDPLAEDIGREGGDVTVSEQRTRKTGTVDDTAGRRPAKLAFLILSDGNDVDRMRHLLPAIYHPENIYLVHVDAKASPENVRQGVKATDPLYRSCSRSALVSYERS